MGFFIKNLSLTITLHPSFFGQRMRSYLKARLIADVEGTFSGQDGYVICVLDSNQIEIDNGYVLPGRGEAEFIVHYRALMWRPIKGEVLDGIVTTVNKMGFFADLGPLSVFVSSHLIPPDLEFDPKSNPPNFSGRDQLIEKGVKVRLKIVGTRVDATKLYAIATIKEDYLGVL